MTPVEFNAFCGKLPYATHAVQWGGAEVWKVGGRLFAALWAGDGKNAGITFKTSPMSFELLADRPGLRPAPYLATRGIKWIQRYSDESMNDDDLKDYLRNSHALVFASLPRRQREGLVAAQ